MPPKRTKEAIRDEKTANVARLIRQGRTTREIADELQMSQTTVWRVAKKAQALYRQASIESIAELRERQKAEIADVKREAWDAWKQSRGVARKKTERRKGRRSNDGKAQPEIEITDTEENQCGDPRYLEIVLRAMDREAKLFGADTKPDDPPPPAQVNVQVNVGNNVQQVLNEPGYLDYLRTVAAGSDPGPVRADGQ